MAAFIVAIRGTPGQAVLLGLAAAESPTAVVCGSRSSGCSLVASGALRRPLHLQLVPAALIMRLEVLEDSVPHTARAWPRMDGRLFFLHTFV